MTSAYVYDVCVCVLLLVVYLYVCVCVCETALRTKRCVRIGTASERRINEHNNNGTKEERNYDVIKSTKSQNGPGGQKLYWKELYLYKNTMDKKSTGQDTGGRGRRLNAYAYITELRSSA